MASQSTPANAPSDLDDLVFLSTSEYFETLTQLITGLVLRYIRLHSVRLLNDNGTLAPNSASEREVIQIAGLKHDTAGDAWLNSRDFPTLADIENMLARFRPYIQKRVDATRDTGYEHLLRPGIIQKQFCLSEQELLFLCAVAAPQLNHRLLRLYQFATGLDSTIFPCSFYMDLLSEPENRPADLLRLLLPESPLRMFSLIEVGQRKEWDSRTPILHAPLNVPNRIASFLIGLDDDCSVTYAHIWHKNSICPELTLPDGFKTTLTRHINKSRAPIGLFGTKGFGRRSCIREIAAKRDSSVLEIDLSQIHAQETESSLIRTAGMWFREARLQRAIMVFRCDGIDAEIQHRFEEISDRFQQMLRRHTEPICLTANHPLSWIKTLFGNLTEIHCPMPSRSDQPFLWRKALSSWLDDDILEQSVQYISSSYVLTAGEIDGAIKATAARIGATEINGETLAETLRLSRGKALEGLADLKSTPLGLNDIVLSESALTTIHEILNFAQYSEFVNRDWGFSHLSSASGLSVLFSGPPGTGKTLTAGVIAHELRRALYVVDISRVVDKYIGETEKRLAKIFDHAQESQAILLFDEADSLFAKRTSVKSSNDRYANLEVNYLLQRLESYRGVSILTTNLADSLDEALARRIQFKIAFPMPDLKERARLWDILLPKQARNPDIDFTRLAEGFEMSGGHIRNAVFRACIQAASSNSPVDTEMLWDAGIHEFREMGHIVRDGEREDYV